MTDKPKEYGRYCGENPETVREILSNGSEGLTIAGIECPHRKYIGGSWQSFCSPEDRRIQGCRP